MKTLKLIAAALVAAFISTVNAALVTNTINGVSWAYSVGDDGTSVTLGGGTTQTPAIATGKTTYVDASKIPWTFSLGGVNYTVTNIAARAFNEGGRIYGTLSIPSTVKTVNGNYTFTDHKDAGKALTNLIFNAGSTTGNNNFKGNTVLEAAWIKTGNKFQMNEAFNGCTAMKVVLFGEDVVPNFTAGKYLFAGSAAQATVFCPDTSIWSSFTALSSNASSTGEIIKYGSGCDLDLDIDEAAHTITATCATLDTLKAVLGSAQYFKSGMGLDTRINVTNALEITSGVITADQLAYATFNSLELKVTSQAQLDAVLAVVPTTVPLAIDPSETTENLTVSTSDGRKVYVLLPEGQTYKVKRDGLIIIFR